MTTLSGGRWALRNAQAKRENEPYAGSETVIMKHHAFGLPNVRFRSSAREPDISKALIELSAGTGQGLEMIDTAFPRGNRRRLPMA